MSRQRRLLIVVIILGAGLAFALLGLKKPTALPLAPALPTTAFSGPRISLADLRGRPAFVVFWASWCTPCAAEAPAIERFDRTLGKRANLIGIDWNDPSSSDARAFVRHYHWSFPILRDGEGLVGDRFGLHGLPTTYLLDDDGLIASTLTGQQTEGTLEAALQTQ